MYGSVALRFNNLSGCTVKCNKSSMRANVKPRPNVYGQNEKSIVRCISDASGSYVRQFDVYMPIRKAL